MFRELRVNTPGLAGGTELLVLAPIKPGFVPTLQSITYLSRAKALLRLLHGARQSQHEYRLLRAVSDAVERVGVIHSLRVTVVESEGGADPRILLSVNFDGAFESYVRVIWQKASRLLDLIFCNTVDYPTGWDHSFDEWSRWMRSVQVQTPFFYSPPGVTYQDLTYLRMFERRDRGLAADEASRTRIRVPTAEEITWSSDTDLVDLTARPDAPEPSTDLPLRESFHQGLQGLAGIHRLADLYRENTDDGVVLLRAAQELLPELAVMLSPGSPFSTDIRTAAGEQLARQLAWFDRAVALPLPPVRRVPELPADEPAFDRHAVQGGVVHEYSGVTHGCICLLAFDTAAAAAAFVDAVHPTFDDAAVEPDAPLVNVAFTPQGLRACGVSEAQLAWFPLEFRQGMAARAGVLGDVRGNHPRRWTLPRQNWPAALSGPDAETPGGSPGVPPDGVHAVLQLRVKASDAALGVALLAKALQALIGGLAGVRPLSLQWMQRLRAKDDNDKALDHFGFADGQSQPQFRPPPQGAKFANQVQLGEVLVGFDNASDHALDQHVNLDPQSRELLRAGSYLVVRKLRQNVQALNEAVQRVVEGEAGLPEGARRMTADDVLAHMMGRWPANAANGKGGKALTVLEGATLNDFNYVLDADGQTCPVTAHIRRANPRDAGNELPPSIPGGRMPRIMRRSLPYGPKVTENNSEADRGLIFMAYNASLGEQFEVIQRWLAGGNSSRGYSGSACPFLGVPEPGRKRNHRFEFDGRTVHMHVDGTDDLGVEPEGLVTLQWGLYAFAPSAQGLQFLLRSARAARPDLPWSAADGVRRIERLRRMEAQGDAGAAALAWKAALEDSEAQAQFESASIWAAVRECYGGVLRIPYGVLVASRALVDQVLSDSEQRYTTAGYQHRLAQSLGPIFLGMDRSDPDYARQSTRCNEAIQKLSVGDGFTAGRVAARRALAALIAHAMDNARTDGLQRWELAVEGRDIVESTLAELCELWFGLKSDAKKGPFVRGGFDWSWKPGQPVFYPGHFTSVSRATFQPEPSAEVAAISIEHGVALRKAMLEFVQANAKTIAAPISRAVLDDLGADLPLAARTIAGAMMGILPTTQGVLLRVLGEWTLDATLQSLRAQVPAEGLGDPAAAKAVLDVPLRRTMMLRPVPEQIWRLARSAHWLGDDCASRVFVNSGDKLILALVSATQQGLASAGDADVMPIFGGDRSAGAAAPTHACPGYQAAMGVMLGMFSALLDVEDARLDPSPAPGILAYSGPIHDVQRGARALVPLGPRRQLEGEALASRGELLGYGDSWIFNRFAPVLGYSHLGRELAALGFDTSTFARYSQPSRQLLAMHLQDKESDDATIYGEIRKRLSLFGSDPARHPLPRAILLGGGGNDFKDAPQGTPSGPCRDAGLASPMDLALNMKASDPPIDDGHLRSFLDDMAFRLGEIIERLMRTATDAASKKQLIPIVVHAYDHPLPDGRPSTRFGCPPLRPTFTRKGFPELGNPAAEPAVDPDSRRHMATFIERLNDTYEQVVQTAAAKGTVVQFVRLAGTLEKQKDFADDYTQYWANELHPTEKGFAVLAQVLAAKLEKFAPLAAAQRP